MSKKQEIGELAISLSFESQSFDKQISAINRSINRTEKEFKAAGKGVKNFENTYQGLDAKIQKLTKQLDANNKKLEIQEKEHQSVVKALETSKKKLEEMNGSIDKNSKEWRAQADLVQKNADKLAKLSSDITITKGNISKLTSELNESKTKFEELGNKTQTLDEKLDDISRNADLTQSEFNKLGSELNKNGTYFQKLGNELNKLSSEITTSTNKINAYESEIENLSSVLDKQKNEYSSLEAKIQTYSQHLDRSSSMYGENSSQANEYRQKLLQLKDSFNSLETEINQNENELKEYQTALNNTQREVNELANELLTMPFDKISSDLKSAGDNIKSVGQSMTTGVTVPLVGIGAAATKIGIDFDRAMSQVQAISGATGDDFYKLKTMAENMGSSTKFSASQAAEAMTYMGMAGWKTNDMLSGLPGILNLAAAGGTDLAIASDIVTDGLTGLGLTANDSSKFVDIMAATITNANTNVEMMGETLKYAGPVAGSLGIKMEDLSLAIGLMGNAGIKSSQAGTALRGGLTNLVKPTDQIAAAMEKYGINIKKTSDGSVDFMATIKLLRDKLGGLEETTQANVLATIFGKEAMSGWASIVNASESDFEKLSSAISNSNEKATELAEVMQQNLGGSIDNMKSALEGALKDGFEAMLPVLEKVVEWITEAANWFSSLDEEAQKNIVTMAGVAAVVGPLLMAFGQLVIVGGNAVNLFGALKTGASNNIKMFGLLKGAISLVSGPAGLVALVGMLIAVMAKLGDNEEKLSELQEKWGVFGQAIGMICESMTGTVELSIGNIGILISTLGKTIMAILSGDFKSIDDIWSEGWAKVENNTAKAMSNIQSESTNGIALMREMTERELNNLTGTFDVALKKLPDLTANNASDIADTFITRMQGLDSKTLTILRGTSDTMAVLFEGIYENMSKEDAKNKFTSNLESMAKSGEFTSDKINQDISEAMNLIDRNVVDGSERVKKSAQSMFDSISNISQFGMDSAINNIVSSINNMSDTTIQQLSNMGGHWKDLFGGIALTGKDAVADMEGHIRGRLETMAKDHPEFVSQMKEQMLVYFEQINSDGSSNIDAMGNNINYTLTEIENSLDEHTKNGGTKAIQNAKNTKDGVSKEFNETAVNLDKSTKQGGDAAAKNIENTSKKVSNSSKQMEQNVKGSMSGVNNNMQQEATNMYKGVSTSMHMMEKKSKQSATNMYKGVTTSTSKMAQKSRQDASHMHNGVRDSASAMSKKARISATEMYKGVTTSTSKMADKAISDWNRIRTAYSEPITAKINKTISTNTISNENASTRNIDNPGIINNIKTLAKIRTPDISEFDISGAYYRSNNSSNIIARTRNSKDNEYSYEQNMSSIKTIENTLNNVVSVLNNLIDAFSSNIQVEATFNIDGTTLAKTTASKFDSVNGNRLNLTERGLLI